ncbi:MAG TPA: DUF971 domain-containing protein [Gemmatimonadota bacterium]
MTPETGTGRRGPRLEPVDMERDESSLTLVWNDRHRSVYAYDDLRRACPCATCRTEREKAEQAGGLRVLPADAPVRAALADVQWVGWYAFRLAWADGHDTGIYSFEYLRALCACAECAAARGAG